MAGRLAREAPHLDGSEPIGVWFDAAWATYLDVQLAMGQVGVEEEKLQEAYESLGEPLDDNGQPTPETWGTSTQAQQGQAAMFAMFGATPDMGAAPTVGDEG